VDPLTGYRYYDESAVERARAVRALRDLDFTVEEIARILPAARDDEDLGEALERKAAELEELAAAYGKKAALIRRELELAARSSAARTVASDAGLAVRLIRAPALRFAALRCRGRYQDVGRRFGVLYRALGRHARGPAFSLYHETAYSDEADISTCVEIGEAPVDRETLAEAGISVVQLDAEEGAETYHIGPYSRLGSAYGRLFSFAVETGRELRPPVREFYEKGPGLVFRGDQERYRTRIFFPFAG
jgi:DNA-binding transcriptional MerR regulator